MEMPFFENYKVLTEDQEEEDEFLGHWDEDEEEGDERF
jgi:hypothetical protein